MGGADLGSTDFATQFTRHVPFPQQLIPLASIICKPLASCIIRAVLIPAATLKPAALIPAATLKPATLIPAAIHKPAALNPAAVHKPATLIPAAIHKLAALIPAAIHKPAVLIPAAIFKSAALNPAAVHKPAAPITAAVHKPAALITAAVHKPAALIPAAVHMPDNCSKSAAAPCANPSNPLLEELRPTAPHCATATTAPLAATSITRAQSLSKLLFLICDDRCEAQGGETHSQGNHRRVSPCQFQCEPLTALRNGYNSVLKVTTAKLTTAQQLQQLATAPNPEPVQQHLIQLAPQQLAPHRQQSVQLASHQQLVQLVLQQLRDHSASDADVQFDQSPKLDRAIYRHEANAGLIALCLLLLTIHLPAFNPIGIAAAFKPAVHLLAATHKSAASIPATHGGATVSHICMAATAIGTRITHARWLETVGPL